MTPMSMPPEERIIPSLKQEVLQAIQEIAHRNGRPPGSHAFERETKFRKADWYPHLWLRWGDALKDAGLTPNTFQLPISEATIIHHYIQLTRQL